MCIQGFFNCRSEPAEARMMHLHQSWLFCALNSYWIEAYSGGSKWGYIPNTMGENKPLWCHFMVRGVVNVPCLLTIYCYLFSYDFCVNNMFLVCQLVVSYFVKWDFFIVKWRDFSFEFMWWRWETKRSLLIASF